MAGGKKGNSGSGETSKKASGQARKAEAAAAKLAAEEAKKEAVEADEWTKGVKSSAKKEAEAAKKAELARKKAEKEALLVEEEKSLLTKPAPKKSKAPVKKPAKGLDLAQLGSDDEDDKKKPGIAASNIDDALDALDLDAGAGTKIDRHPERRRKAAYAAFEERRLTEMDTDGSGQGLRLNQKKERIRKEFEKSPENPFNQVSVDYDATKDEVAQLREAERIKTEARLTARD
ncbi:duf1014 domain-containing protein [Lasiosphaeria hispida]|uniref:Duf1014 domain-containing protein n=1 Tax=Lasiosphaeria hispida TaxID=260671 RepID=A0AAJ0HIF7_9PEZI|nr:duf1014 domain-containing protein [Lasiosphaeria hispida]